MISTSHKHFSLKRIQRDIKEIQDEDLPGLSACILDVDNTKTISACVIVQEGVYKGLLVPLRIELTEDYPISAPSVKIYKNFPFTNRFHEHVYPRDGELTVCTDLTSDFAWWFSRQNPGAKPVTSGWTPAYTLQAILIQLQVFFAYPDYSPS